MGERRFEERRRGRLHGTRFVPDRFWLLFREDLILSLPDCDSAACRKTESWRMIRDLQSPALYRSCLPGLDIAV